MNILVLNSGTSTLKYQLIDMRTSTVTMKGNIERIGEATGKIATHKEAVQEMFKQLGDKAVDAIGHRVVHGGELFKSSALATDETLNYVNKVSHLAPLHNPANIDGVEVCRKLFPKIPSVMVFDTAFHSTLEPKSYLYALPLDDYNDHGIRRYGFHGPSHNFVSKKCAEMMNKPREELKVITIHYGNGSSICAVDRGRSVETSMGLTPLEGLVMGTRSGDVDPAVVQYLAEAHKLDIAGTIQYLNKKCGIMALAGIGSNDVRDLVLQIDKPHVQTAFDVVCHRILKYIGAYIAVMDGVDAIVWTGGVGNNMPIIREKVHANLSYIGANIDQQFNAVFYNNGKTGEITMDGSRVRTFVINTNEELEIAQEVMQLIKK